MNNQHRSTGSKIEELWPNGYGSGCCYNANFNLMHWWLPQQSNSCLFRQIYDRIMHFIPEVYSGVISNCPFYLHFNVSIALIGINIVNAWIYLYSRRPQQNTPVYTYLLFEHLESRMKCEGTYPCVYLVYIIKTIHGGKNKSGTERTNLVQTFKITNHMQIHP